MAYRVYVTDAVKLAIENIARIAGGGLMSSRFVDLVYPEPEDNRTREEIIAEENRISEEIIAKVRKALGGGLE